MHFLHIAFIAITAWAGLTTTYKDEAAKFSVEYPINWDKKIVNDYHSVAFLSPLEKEDVFQENVNIMQQDLSASPMSLAEFVELSHTQITGAKGKILNEKGITFAKLPAHQITYTAAMGGTKLKFYQVWMVKKNTAFVFTYTAPEDTFSKYEPQGMAIINSFKFY